MSTLSTIRNFVSQETMTEILKFVESSSYITVLEALNGSQISQYWIGLEKSAAPVHKSQTNLPYFTSLQTLELTDWLQKPKLLKNFESVLSLENLSVADSFYVCPCSTCVSVVNCKTGDFTSNSSPGSAKRCPGTDSTKYSDLLQLPDFPDFGKNNDCSSKVDACSSKDLPPLFTPAQIAKQHVLQKFMYVVQLFVSNRSTLKKIDFGEIPSYAYTSNEDASFLPPFKFDFKNNSGNSLYSFDKLEEIRFGLFLDCRLIVPLIDFCSFKKLSSLTILGLCLRYTFLAPKFGKEPTLVFGPQNLFTESEESDSWLPAIYNGKVDDKLQLEGDGVYVSREYQYEGSFSGGRNSGFGVMTSKCGERYEGMWKEGRRHGQGTVVQSDGRCLSGEWHNDVLSGHGSMELVSGYKYEGCWVNGALDGWCVVSRNETILAVGVFSLGKPFGWMLSHCSCPSFSIETIEQSKLLRTIDTVYIGDRNRSFLTQDSFCIQNASILKNEFSEFESYSLETPPSFKQRSIFSLNDKKVALSENREFLEGVKILCGSGNWKCSWREINIPKLIDSSYGPMIDMLPDCGPKLQDIVVLNPKLSKQKPGLESHFKHHQNDIVPHDVPQWVVERVWNIVDKN